MTFASAAMAAHTGVEVGSHGETINMVSTTAGAGLVLQRKPAGSLLQVAQQQSSRSVKIDTVNDSSLLDTQELQSTVQRCTDSQPLIFLHIPKNAGTAIEDAAYAQGISWGRYMDFKSCSLGSEACVASWHTPPRLLQGISMYTNSTVFCVVRDPYLRAISEYQYFAAHPEFRDQYSSAPLPVDPCSAVGLNAFLGYVLTEFLNGHTLLGMCHILPQSHYIWAPPNASGHQEQTCKEVLRLEDFPTAFDELMTRYGYTDLRLPPHRINKATCSNLGPKDLSSYVKSLLSQVYAQDFAKLGYKEL